VDIIHISLFSHVNCGITKTTDRWGKWWMNLLLVCLLMMHCFHASTVMPKRDWKSWKSQILAYTDVPYKVAPSKTLLAKRQIHTFLMWTSSPFIVFLNGSDYLFHATWESYEIYLIDSARARLRPKMTGKCENCTHVLSYDISPLSRTPPTQCFTFIRAQTTK
jgi:hypothetical protein